MRLILLLLVWAPLQALAWGRQGHSLVAQAAAYLTTAETKNPIMKDRAFDLGYYANVPDFLWKAPAYYAEESTNHYMDLEIFERAMNQSAYSRKRFRAKIMTRPCLYLDSNLKKNFRELPLKRVDSFGEFENS